MFKLKHDVDGRVERIKARLVAKGYARNMGLTMTKFSRLQFVSLQFAFC